MHFPTWPRPSTRAFVREARRLPGYSFFDWLHGYVYARWPYLYIGIGTGEHPLAKRAKPAVGWIGRLIEGRAAKAPASIVVMPDGSERPAGAEQSLGFADTYHGKVVTLAAATQLVSVQQDINLGDLEHIIPYTAARDIVLRNPDHIVAMECPCRAARPNPCLPMDVCLIVGEPFASFVTEHHPGRSRAITSAEAAEILRAEHARGHVHHAFFKDAMLGRFYAICNCCACCCGALQARRSGVPMLAASGYASVLDATLCIGCGECAAFCQFGAIVRTDGQSWINTAACMGCGVCVDQCAHGALALVRDESKGIPLEINDLMRAALGGVHPG